MSRPHKYPARVMITTSEQVRKRDLILFIEDALNDRIIVPGKAARVEKVRVQAVDSD